MINERQQRISLLFLILILTIFLAACAGSSNDTGDAGSPGEAGFVDFSCNPTEPPQSGYQSPQQVIREGYDYTATITMENGGEVVIEFFEDEAPITTNNFVFLACEGYYDGVTFHRVLPGFVAQGGDPTGTGSGGPGYTIQHEAENGIAFDRSGLLSMAHASRPNSTGSQFFITYAPVPQLDADFTVFGEVVEGMEVVESITPRNPAQNPGAPPGDVIRSIRVTEMPR